MRDKLINKLLPVTTLNNTMGFMVQPQTWLTALIGVIGIETFFRLAPKFGLARIDFATMNGTLFFPEGRKARLLGLSMFCLGAVGWVSLFRALKPEIKGSSVSKSVKFGTGLFLLTSLVVMPLTGLINPQMTKGKLKKPGFFGLQLAGWKTTASNFLGHILFASLINKR